MSWNELLDMALLEDIALPFESMATPESAEVVAEPIVCERNCLEGFSPKSSPSLWKWRRVSLAISACNRMLLAMETIKAVDEQTAVKAGAEINVAFAGASQSPFPDPLRWPTSEERMVGTLPNLQFNCKCFRTPAGKLRVEMESVEAVEQAIFDQVASEVPARVDSLTSLIIGRVEEVQDPELQNMIPGVAAAQTADVFALKEPSHCGSFEAFLDEVLGGLAVEQAADSQYSATISAFDEPMQSGIIDQISEQHEVSDSESPMKTMEDDPEWKELILNTVNSKVLEIYDDINQSSDRAKLQNTESEAQECSDKLQKDICRFQGEFIRMFNDLKTNLAKVSKHVPEHLEHQLNRAIYEVNHFKSKELKRLVSEADVIKRKLDVKVVRDLRYRNLSASKMFQQCASSFTQLVESLLVMTSKFISVGDFNRYISELYRLPHFRFSVGKVARS